MTESQELEAGKTMKVYYYLSAWYAKTKFPIGCINEVYASPCFTVGQQVRFVKGTYWDKAYPNMVGRITSLATMDGLPFMYNGRFLYGVTLPDRKEPHRVCEDEMEAAPGIVDN